MSNQHNGDGAITGQKWDTTYYPCVHFCLQWLAAPINLGVCGTAVNSPSGVWSRASAKIEFSAIWPLNLISSEYDYVILARNYWLNLAKYRQKRGVCYLLQKAEDTCIPRIAINVAYVCNDNVSITLCNINRTRSKSQLTQWTLNITARDELAAHLHAILTDCQPSSNTLWMKDHTQTNKTCDIPAHMSTDTDTHYYPSRETELKHQAPDTCSKNWRHKFNASFLCRCTTS